MTHHDTDKDDAIDPIDALRSELKRVPLSPEFTARLRQRIDAQPDVRGAAWLGGWRWLVPVAAVAAVVVAVVAIRQPRTRDVEQAALKTLADVSNPVALPAPAQAPGGSSTFEVRSSKSGRRMPAVAVTAAAVPALQVITNQPAILRALWARVGKGAPIVEVSASVAPDTVPEIVVAPIEVSPIVVKPLEPQPAPGGLPIVR